MGEGSSGRDGGEVEGRFHHFLGGLTLPVTAMSWLMFELYVERSAEKVIAELERPLSTLIRPGQDVIDSMAASMTTMSVEDVSRRTLNVCEGEGDNYAFGYELNGDHPLVPSGLGTMTGARFVSCLLEEENTVVIINSCLYEKGYMAVGTYERRDDGVEVTVNSVFHRDRPGDILFQLSSTDYPVGPHTNSISLLEERRKGLSSWDRTRKFYNHSTHGWRQFSIVCRRKEANGAVITSLLQKNVTLYSSRTMDTRDLHDLQIQYVHTLIDDHQDRPMMIPALNSVATNIKRNRDGRFGFIMPPEVDGTSRSTENNAPDVNAPALDESAMNEDKEDLEKLERICPQCSATFKRKYEMRRHLATVHYGVRRFPCHICNKNFTQNGHVRVHIETVHEKRRTEKCDVCGLAFGTKHKRDRHRRAVHERRM